MAVPGASEDRRVELRINRVAFDALGLYATKVGQKTGAYAQMLFEAAFAARVGQRVDRDLDTAVRRAVLLHATKHDTKAIAELVHLSEATVVRILDEWRKETSKGTRA